MRKVFLKLVAVFLFTALISPSIHAANPMPALPAPGTYSIDSTHSFVYFSAWHHIVGVVRGRFEKVTGTITVSKDLAQCSVDVSIDTSSISTQNTRRDQDLRGPDFFVTQKYPAMTYKGRGIRHVSGDMWKMDGSLTIRGVTKAVPLTFSFKGAFADTPPGEPVRVAFHGVAATKRGDYGMTRDNLMELGPSPTKPDVEIQIDVEADASSPKK
ncbi:MAG TPA: YceI family protein [Edaphobacter sp.]|nr:YceI family protein [Edaphobacter sp.]